jgi:hypothetical protein
MDKDGGEGRDGEHGREGTNGSVGDKAEEREERREGEGVGVAAVVFEVGGGVVGEGSVLVDVGEVGCGDKEDGSGFGAGEREESGEEDTGEGVSDDIHGLA